MAAILPPLRGFTRYSGEKQNSTKFSHLDRYEIRWGDFEGAKLSALKTIFEHYPQIKDVNGTLDEYEITLFIPSNDFKFKQVLERYFRLLGLTDDKWDSDGVYYDPDYGFGVSPLRGFTDNEWACGSKTPILDEIKRVLPTKESQELLQAGGAKTSSWFKTSAFLGAFMAFVFGVGTFFFKDCEE